jgi:YebC/PmpR family DNA-binding regulatory protein
MSGHSKWHSIRHKKAAVDTKRGKIFSKIVKEIAVAARLGGGDLNSNPRLRTVVAKAKSANMPSDNIEKAIKKGTGELPGVHYEEVTYEGYGPGGVAIMVNCLTDNKNRTAAEIRNIFSKKHGNMAGQGSVAWNFEKRGLITVEKSAEDEEELFSLVLDAGADDFNSEEKDIYEVHTKPEMLEDVKRTLEGKGIKYSLAEVTLIPKSTVKVDEKEASRVLELMESLEEHDDVQGVSSNFDIPDEILEAAGRE